MPVVVLAVLVVLCIERYQFKRHVWDVQPANFVPAYKVRRLLLRTRHLQLNDMTDRMDSPALLLLLRQSS